MSKEKVLEILSHVDMTKIDLSSFKIGEKKFNELATLYKNRVILSCIDAIINKDTWPKEDFDYAFTMLQKVVDDPDIYSYASIYSDERKAVDAAIDDITTRRDRNINDVKIKAIEKRMKDAYKQMRKSIEMALENGNAFEYEFDEETVERCLQIAKNAIEKGRQKAAEDHINKATGMTQQTEQAIPESNENTCCKEDNQPMIVASEQHKDPKPKKISFWKRIFRKHEVSENV